MSVLGWLRNFCHLKLWLNRFLFNLLNLFCNRLRFFWSLESKFWLVVIVISINLFICHSLCLLILMNNSLSNQICGFRWLYGFPHNDRFWFEFWNFFFILCHLLWFLLYFFLFWFAVLSLVFFLVLLVIAIMKFCLQFFSYDIKCSSLSELFRWLSSFLISNNEMLTFVWSSVMMMVVVRFVSVFCLSLLSGRHCNCINLGCSHH